MHLKLGLDWLIAAQPWYAGERGAERSERSVPALAALGSQRSQPSVLASPRALPSLLVASDQVATGVSVARRRRRPRAGRPVGTIDNDSDTGTVLYGTLPD